MPMMTFGPGSLSGCGVWRPEDGQPGEARVWEEGERDGAEIH